MPGLPDFSRIPSNHRKCSPTSSESPHPAPAIMDNISPSYPPNSPDSTPLWLFSNPRWPVEHPPPSSQHTRSSNRLDRAPKAPSFAQSISSLAANSKLGRIRIAASGHRRRNSRPFAGPRLETR